MEIKKLNLKDLKKVNEMYKEYLNWYPDTNVDCYEFADKYIEKCDNCGEIVYWDNIAERTMWNGKKVLCCEKCQEYGDEEEKYYTDLRNDSYDNE